MFVRSLSLLIAASLLLLTGCTARSTVVVHSTQGQVPSFVDAAWSLTRPQLLGGLRMAASAGHVYLLECTHSRARLSKLAEDGEFEWTREIAPRCSIGEHDVAMAASEEGVFVAIHAGKGRMVFHHGADGTLRWKKQVVGSVPTIGVTASTGRSAVWFKTSSSGLTFDGVPLEISKTYVFGYDGQGSLVERHQLSKIFDSDAQCSFDDTGGLWFTARFEFPKKAVQVDATTHDLAPGIWAVRLMTKPRLLPLSSSKHFKKVTAVPSGFVVNQYKGALELFDYSGSSVWRIDLPTTGCTTSPTVISASPSRLLASVNVFCATRNEAVRFADLTIEDQGARGDSLGSTTLLVELDTTSMKTLRVFELSPPRSTRYVVGPQEVISYGAFTELLVLDGTRSGPATYHCESTLPSHAETWDSYPSEQPSCRAGYALETNYPSWPFVAGLPLTP